MFAVTGIFQLVQCIDIGICRSDHDVGIRPLPADDTPCLFETHGDFTLRICTAGYIVDRVQLQLSIAVDDALYRTESRVDWTTTGSACFYFIATDFEYDIGIRGFSNL